MPLRLPHFAQKSCTNFGKGQDKKKKKIDPDYFIGWVKDTWTTAIKNVAQC